MSSPLINAPITRTDALAGTSSSIASGGNAALATIIALKIARKKMTASSSMRAILPHLLSRFSRSLSLARINQRQPGGETDRERADHRKTFLPRFRGHGGCGKTMCREEATSAAGATNSNVITSQA
jgi:hypothetical protein